MWFRLALEMGCTVLELKQRMTLLEFRQWCVYHTKEPFGFFAQHFHAGLIASTIDNCRQTYKRRNKWASIADYMPFVKREHKRKPIPTAEQFINMLKMNYALAGKELEIIDNRGKTNG